MKNLDESKNGFWGVLARKAKSIIEDNNVTQQSEMPGTTRSQFPGVASRVKVSLKLYLKSSTRILQIRMLSPGKNIELFDMISFIHNFSS